ncbi:MAG TPA: hypothetical protein VFR40_14875 [Lapillicoccus sp.]|nr:hypothetical protein [Lapillicoccus sp.]
MKPSPLSAVLADDLLLDRVGARLDADDDLGALLLAVAHQADTPIPAPPRRRRRGHRGLTVLAALGVAVSGATVAAAVELAPMPSDQASGRPHTRTFLPPSLQALVMPFLAGTPFQGRLVLPFGSLPTVPLVGTSTAAGLPGASLPVDALALPSSGATPFADSELGNQEQQDLSRQKTEAKGTQTNQGQIGQGQIVDQSGATADPGDGDQGDEPQPAPTTKPTKPTPTPTPTPTTTNTGNGATNGQANGAGNGNGHGRTTTGTTTGGTTTGDTGAIDGTGTTDDEDTGDDPASGGPDKHGKTMRLTTATAPVRDKATSGTAPTRPTPTSTSAGTTAAATAETVPADGGTVTP